MKIKNQLLKKFIVNMNLSKIIKTNAGLSLIEVTVALALLGVGSLAFMRMSSNQVVSQKRVEESAEIILVSSIISQSLATKEGCLNSVGANTVINNSGNTNLSEIQNIGGATIVEVGQDYGNSNLIKTNSIYISSPSFGPVSAGEKRGSANVNIEFVKINKAVQGKLLAERTIKKRFPISFAVDASNNQLISCFDTVSGAVTTAKEESCIAIGGVLNNVGKCVLQNYNSVSPTQDNYVAVSTQNQRDFMNHMKATELNNEYINSNNGNETINASLTVSANLNATKVIADAELCVDDRCRDFSRIECTPGFVLIGVDSNGAKVCRKAKYVLGDDLCSGNPIENNGDGILRCSGTNPTCTDPWLPAFDPAQNCTTVTQTQTRCSESRTVTGTKTTGSCDLSCTQGNSCNNDSDCGSGSCQQSNDYYCSGDYLAGYIHVPSHIGHSCSSSIANGKTNTTCSSLAVPTANIGNYYQCVSDSFRPCQEDRTSCTGNNQTSCESTSPSCSWLRSPAKFCSCN